ncbi:MAG: hypothetical protein J6P95_05965, partial [Paludibacteraceae bacterium]|nr:hypothetical protein [Paludibacteraceae bacterium]
MKKIRYSFISLLLVVVYATVNAQVYTETFSRTFATIAPDLKINDVNWAKGGGTTEINSIIKSVNVVQRGAEKFSHTTQSSDFSYANGDALGVLMDGYLDLSDEMVDVEIVAGQEFTISAFGEGNSVPWANAVAYVDWDGNGAFDDHELKKYNLYDISSVHKVEFAAAQNKPLDAKWNFLAPNVTEERLVRIRIRYDEAINETVNRKKTGILDWANESSTTGGIPECNMVQALDVNYQTFSSMFLNRFTPSGQLAKGTTVDLTVKIVPDPYATAMQEMETVVGAGNVGATCQSTQGTAITDAAGFAAFMSATSGNYYLANDITLTSLPVSQTTFNG